MCVGMFIGLRGGGILFERERGFVLLFLVFLSLVNTIRVVGDCQ